MKRLAFLAISNVIHVIPRPKTHPTRSHRRGPRNLTVKDLYHTSLINGY
jgi:hypothetical protein